MRSLGSGATRIANHDFVIAKKDWCLDLLSADVGNICTAGLTCPFLTSGRSPSSGNENSGKCDMVLLCGAKDEQEKDLVVFDLGTAL